MHTQNDIEGQATAGHELLGDLPSKETENRTSRTPTPNQTDERLPPSYVPFDHLIRGYPKLAGAMSREPHLCIFRRFTALNAQNLLYLQAEIVHLEKDLREMERQNNLSSSGNRSEYACTWFHLKHSEEDDGDGRQWDLVQKLRETLKEYNDLLIQMQALKRFSGPRADDLDDLQRLLATDEMACAIVGRDSNVYGTYIYPDDYAPDLISLIPAMREDSFSHWLAATGGAWWFATFGRFQKPSKRTGRKIVTQQTLLRATYWITSIIAAVLPVSSILVLYYVQSTPARLGITAAFNLVVSICLTAFTNAKRAEVFSTTAAFAAVQVVFIGVDKN